MSKKTCGKCKYSFGNARNAKFCTKYNNKIVSSYRKGCGHFLEEEVPTIGVFDAQCQNSSDSIDIEYDNIVKGDTLNFTIYSDFDNVTLSREDSIAMAEAILEHYRKLDTKKQEKIDF